VWIMARADDAPLSISELSPHHTGVLKSFEAAIHIFPYVSKCSRSPQSQDTSDLELRLFVLRSVIQLEL
jgi:hypothetical protein